MRSKLKKELMALSYFVLLSGVVYLFAGAFFLLIFVPFLRWFFINSTYEWPELTEIVKYIKAVAMLTLVTALPLWYSEKRQSGR